MWSCYDPGPDVNVQCDNKYPGLHHNNSIHRREARNPTSCFLFVMFVDMLIRKIKQCGDDGFLKWLHVLMSMDDTVIMETTRERLTEKLKYLEEYGD